MYAVGGFQDGGLGLIDRLETYDAVTDSWSTGTPMPTGRTNLGFVAAEGLLYAVGGSDATGPSGALEAYDPDNDAWTVLPPMPTPRSGIAVAHVGGFLFVIGGHDGSTVRNIVEVYDIANATWCTMQAMPTSRSHHVAVPARERDPRSRRSCKWCRVQRQRTPDSTVSHQRGLGGSRGDDDASVRALGGDGRSQGFPLRRAWNTDATRDGERGL